MFLNKSIIEKVKIVVGYVNLLFSKTCVLLLGLGFERERRIPWSCKIAISVKNPEGSSSSFFCVFLVIFFFYTSLTKLLWVP